MPLSFCGQKTNSQGKEIVQHGTTLFPIACYKEDSTKHTVPWHWHDEFEFIVAMTDGLEVQLEKTTISLHQGEGIFINSSVLHTVKIFSQNPTVFYSIVFHPRLIGGSRDSIFWQKLIQPLLQKSSFRYLLLNPSISWQAEILSCIILAWQATVAESEDYENLVRYKLSVAFRLLNKHHSVTTPKISQRELISTERMKMMLQFIEEHYNEEMTVGRIANCISVSESVCLRCFRQILGTTPIQYLKQLRIEKATELLLTTNMKVNEIGMECGFSDISYFTKTFREVKGYAPKEYKNMFCISDANQFLKERTQREW